MSTMQGCALRRMEVEVISRQEPPSRDGAQHVFALHGPDVSLELSMLRTLMQLKEAALPILPALLGPPAQAYTPDPPPSCSICVIRIMPLAETYVLSKPKVTRALRPASRPLRTGCVCVGRQCCTRHARLQCWAIR